MTTLNVKFEGESLEDYDDQIISFEVLIDKIPTPEDFMAKMFEYLESNHPYHILYQIKSVFDSKEDQFDTKPFVAVIGRWRRGGNKGILLKEENEKLFIVGSWEVKDVKKILEDLYSKPESFELVVVTVSESVAPK